MQFPTSAKRGHWRKYASRIKGNAAPGNGLTDCWSRYGRGDGPGRRGQARRKAADAPAAAEGHEAGRAAKRIHDLRARRLATAFHREEPFYQPPDIYIRSDRGAFRSRTKRNHAPRPIDGGCVGCTLLRDRWTELVADLVARWLRDGCGFVHVSHTHSRSKPISSCARRPDRYLLSMVRKPCGFPTGSCQSIVVQ
jgi:hypothetical protein